jgi:hypothetical protein
MDAELKTQAFQALERLLDLASRDPALRCELRGLAEALLQLTSDDQQGGNEALSGSDPSADVETTLEQIESAVALESQEETVREPLPELTLGRVTPTPQPPPSVRAIPRDADELPLLEARSRLKAEGARWAATRRRQLSEGARFGTDIEPKDQDIIARAKALPNCFLWMCHPSGPAPANLALYDEVAGCFETMADAISLVKQIQDQGGTEQAEFETALDLLAEAQSALRGSIDAIEGPADTDQTAVFHWLRNMATESQIFIRRFMRLDDPADAGSWPELLTRVQALECRVQEQQRRQTERKRLLGKIRHKATLIAKTPEDAIDHWKIAGNCIAELIRDGLQPSSREIRELLLPVIELMPELEEPQPEFLLTLREIDRYLASSPAQEMPAAVLPSENVLKAQALLRGKSIVVIGGENRPVACQTLKSQFGLKELIWLETRPHESLDRFLPYVSRPEVAAVLLAIRWSSHSYGDVRQFCDAHGKPLVRLPGGYNPNQVAAQIVAQASERLGKCIPN